MDDAKVTADEVEAMLAGNFRALAEQMATAMNEAKAGSIIADSEEPVRDAHAEFRQQAFEKTLHLLQKKQEAFSPSADRVAKQGSAGGDPQND